MATTTLGGKLRHAWNAFTDQNETYRHQGWDGGVAYGTRPDRVRLSLSNERSIISSIYTRIGIDVASVDIRHVRLDKEKRYIGDMDSGLNNCLELQANLDQAARSFIQDVVLTLFNEGVAALVPVNTSLNPENSGSYEIEDMRVGKIVQWKPRHVRVDLYNEETGRREEVTLMKKNVAIIENPLYAVMNEPNSTLQRLIRTLGRLDAIDEQSASGKLDMIIQLPYNVRSETKKAVADTRRKELELQLKDSKYGIGYIDGTEKVIQLNRAVENNLLKQVEYLMVMLYGQLGITEGVMNGTADEAAMINYTNRTIEPILGAIAQEMKRKFLTKTARTQGQSIEYFRDPFKLIPMKDLAEIADKFTRNEIVSSNEFRGFIGMKPSTDPKADELRNSNMPDPNAAPPAVAPVEGALPVEEDLDANEEEMEAEMDDTFDDIDADIDDIFDEFGVSEDE